VPEPLHRHQHVLEEVPHVEQAGHRRGIRLPEDVRWPLEYIVDVVVGEQEEATYSGTVTVVSFAIPDRKKRSTSKTPPAMAVAVTSTRRRSSARWRARAAWPPWEKPKV
jgi:hypothetical protein